MNAEQAAALVTMLVLGGGLVALGRRGATGRVEFSLGGWTADNSTVHSRNEANRVIGRGLSLAGVVCLAAAVLIAFAPVGWVGPALGVTSGLLLMVVIVSVVRGLGRVRSS